MGKTEETERRTYIAKTGPYISGGPWLLNGGVKGVMKPLLPRDGELCSDPCERSGEEVTLLGYSGSAPGNNCGELF